MNRRPGGDTSLNLPLHDERHAGEWQDALIDETPSPEAILVAHDETVNHHEAEVHAIVVRNDRERGMFEARQLVEEPKTLEDLAAEFKVSRENTADRDPRMKFGLPPKRASRSKARQWPHSARIRRNPGARSISSRWNPPPHLTRERPFRSDRCCSGAGYIHRNAAGGKYDSPRAPTK